MIWKDPPAMKVNVPGSFFVEAAVAHGGVLIVDCLRDDGTQETLHVKAVRLSGMRLQGVYLTFSHT